MGYCSSSVNIFCPSHSDLSILAYSIDSIEPIVMRLGE